MVAKFLFLLGAIAAVVAVPHKSLKRPNYDHVDYYDCSGKSNGNHPHASDCTRFMTCSNGYASDMACPLCNEHDGQCLGEHYLRYNSSTKNCEWPATTPCVTDDQPGNDEPCEGKTEGAACGQDDCEHCGYCKDKLSYYFRCERTFPSDPKQTITGVWRHESCDADLWWNPDLKPNGVGVGGACDKWENLSADTQNKYKADKSCVPEEPVCEWGQDDDDACTEKYWYLDPATMDERENLFCADGLLWDRTTETCRSCGNIAACECPSGQ